jgi:antirestriction protein ArdC
MRSGSELRRRVRRSKGNSTLFHKPTHWSGHEDRCARGLNNRFSDEAYAIEELVAELGAAFLCAELEISPQPREDHAGHIQHWMEVMKADKKAIFSAAAFLRLICADGSMIERPERLKR